MIINQQDPLSKHAQGPALTGQSSPRIAAITGLAAADRPAVRGA
ncbi:hypothetical protein ACR6C2_42535 [Streptomyces sp. INA 01156]